MRKTSRPRTLSRTRTNRFPSETRRVSLAASGQPSSSAILWARRRLADPASNKKSLSTGRTYRAADPTRITPLTQTAVSAAARTVQVDHVWHHGPGGPETTDQLGSDGERDRANVRHRANDCGPLARDTSRPDQDHDHWTSE